MTSCEKSCLIWCWLQLIKKISTHFLQKIDFLPKNQKSSKNTKVPKRPFFEVIDPPTTIYYIFVFSYWLQWCDFCDFRWGTFPEVGENCQKCWFQPIFTNFLVKLTNFPNHTLSKWYGGPSREIEKSPHAARSHHHVLRSQKSRFEQAFSFLPVGKNENASTCVIVFPIFPLNLLI